MKPPAMCFLGKSIGLSRCGNRKPQSLLAAAQHNLRELPSGPLRSFNPATEPNRVLAGPSRACEVVEQAERLKQACDNAQRFKRRDHCQAIEFVISVPSWSGIDVMGYFEASLAWLRQRMALPVLSAVVHHDEEHPHMHILLSPARDGRYMGSAPINKANMQQLRAAFSSEVAVRHGLRHLAPKMAPGAKRAAADWVLSHLRRLDLPSRHELIWPLIDEQVRRDPVPLVELFEGGVAERLAHTNSSCVGIEGGQSNGQINLTGLSNAPSNATRVLRDFECFNDVVRDSKAIVTQTANRLEA